MDAASLVESFLTGQYVVTRRERARFVSGIAVSGPTSSLSISASVQPATGADVLRLPEGRRLVETRVIYTTTQLLVGSEGSPNESDLISIDGQNWEVQHVESWQQAEGSFFRCIAQVSQAAVNP